MPKVFKQLKKILSTLEKHYKDMQDVEFTVENNKLWILQTRSGKRTAKSSVKIAVDMVKEKLISKTLRILGLSRLTFLGLSTLEKFKITLEQIIQTVKGQDNYGNRIFF